jgi:hypothetical protein
MKKNILFLFLFISALVFAQPMSGTYTIGGTNPDFASINSAVANVVFNGVNGPTDFIIRNGTYNEILQIAAIPGASAANRITFMGETADSNLVLINGATTTDQQNSLRLDFLEYVTFKSITVRQLPNVFNNAVVFINRGKYINFENCVLWGHGSSTSSATEYVIQGCADSGFVARNCFIRGANEGLSLSNGSSISHRNVLIENNNFQTGGKQLFMNGGAFSIVRNNYFTSRVLYQTHSRGQFYGNKVFGTFQIISSNGWADNKFKIYNNQIYRTGADLGATYALRIGSSSYLEIYNNTIAINSTNAGYAFFAEGSFTTTSPISFKNNNVYRIDNNSTNHTIRIPNAISYAEGIECDYNNYYSQGPSFMDEYPSFTDWTSTTGFDLHSTNLNPQIVLGEDLLITNPLLFNTGTPIPYIDTDINGNFRNPQNPTVGAFEQLSAPTIDLGSDTTICGTDFVLDAGNPGSLYLWSTGETTQTISLSSSGTYSVFVSNSEGESSDTINVSINPFPTISIIATEDSICAGTQVFFEVTGTTIEGLFWNDLQISLIERMVMPESTTVYSGYFTNALECTSTVEKTIYVHPIVETSFEITENSICSNSGTFNLTGGVPSGGTYFVDGNETVNLELSNYENEFVVVTYSYTSANFCNTTASDSIFVDLCTSTFNNTLNTNNLLYNSIEKMFYFEGESYLNQQFKLYDINGKVVVNKTITSNKLKLDNDLNSGVYISEINFREGVVRSKIILIK